MLLFGVSSISFLIGYFYSKWQDREEVLELNKLTEECINLTKEAVVLLQEENRLLKEKLNEN